MINQCKYCGLIWECHPGKETLRHCNKECDECAFCFSKRTRSRFELVMEMNQDCFPPQPHYNPSERQIGNSKEYWKRWNKLWDEICNR